ncbi:hypothetical protein CTAYLR_004878 [Chrysophaeum taylorii]|uniref:ABC transporter domain-containing protein n=1 Tax=Chrysophaeum taylorii TaxID=2483200 RepID=A0AAD7XPH1_9STRA|nr:hypothetical protein CTAYLR_004878 [Chrysophaeum taylorii]
MDSFADPARISRNWGVEVGGKKLLHEISGTASPGRLVAVCGPSGAGKSTLLKTIASRLKASKSLTASGHVEGVPSRIAFVQQSDLFYEYSTVRETLEFAVRLKLARLSEEEQDKRVAGALAKTGLSKVKDTTVGGISGGERRRLSIARELLDDPECVFLDEPTSGLDSYSAERVARALRALADEGRTVVCVIHQPSAAVFDMFDDLILLSEGELMYSGPISLCDAYFASLGFPRRSASRAEHALAVVSVDVEDETASRRRLEKIAAKAATSARGKHHQRATANDNDDNVVRARASPWTQFRLLYARAARDVGRAKGANAVKAAQQLMTALIYGGIYALDDTQASIQDRFGLLSLSIIGSTNLAVASSIRTFPKEKQIVLGERDLYGAFPYLLSKVAAEVPLVATLSALFGVVVYPLARLQRTMRKFLTFLGVTTLNTVASSALGLLVGALAPSTDAALAVFPVVIVLSVVFNGANISVESTPKLLRWLPTISLVKWGFEALAVNEFTGLVFKPRKRGPPGTLTGEDALDRLDFRHSTVKRALTAQSLILGSSYLQTYRTLKNSKPHFALLAEPPPLAKTHRRPHLAFF